MVTGRPRATRASWAAIIATSALASSGCALLASANAAHTHISPCVDEPGYGVADILIGSGVGLALVATGTIDDSPAWLIVPGVLFASGLIGVISAHRCRERGRRRPAEVPYHPPGPPPVPTDDDDALTPRTPDATPDELGLPPPDPTLPDVKLQLDPTYVPPSDAGPPVDAPISCGATTECPPGHQCRLDGHDAGVCIPAP